VVQLFRSYNILMDELTVYVSRSQRHLRLLVLAGIAIQIFPGVLMPALALSGYILGKGLREDYRAGVLGRILKPGDEKSIELGAPR
jgi:hypothetical protein